MFCEKLLNRRIIYKNLLARIRFFFFGVEGGEGDNMENVDKMTGVLNPIPCAREIVSVLEKYNISIIDLDRVLAVAKDIAYASTIIQTN